MNSRRTDGSATHIPEEYDSYEREAVFYLYTRPLNDMILGESDHEEFHHWALVAVFPDETVRTMEGNEVNGILTPFFLKEAPKDSTDERPGKYYNLGRLKTSPKKLQIVTKENSTNGTQYSAIGNNCQNWVKACAWAISSKMVNSLKNYRTNGEMNFVERAFCSSWASSKSSSKSIRRQLVEDAKNQCKKS